MLSRTTTLALASGLALAIATACSSTSSPTTPTPSADTSGAVVAGVVRTGGGFASDAGGGGASVPAGLTVSVVGTELTSAVDDNTGAFQIPDVPAGTAQLQFRNASVNAMTSLTGITPGQYIEIQVEVTDTTAVILNDEREGKVTLCHAEGNGSYHFINVSESAEPAHRGHGDGQVGDPVPGETYKVFGENCDLLGPEVEIEKSTNGADADSAPGPSIAVGDPVMWEYVVSNTGTVDLTAIVVTDDQGETVDCGGISMLAPGASLTCTATGLATLGQYRNLGSVTADFTMDELSGQVSDSDASHYLGFDPDETIEGLKVDVCHRTGNGSFHLINISVDALPAHIAHGDGKIGDPVPGQADKVFGPGCRID